MFQMYLSAEKGKRRETAALQKQYVKDAGCESPVQSYSLFYEYKKMNK